MKMNRRDGMKTLLIGGLGISALTSCKPEQVNEQEPENQITEFGRTEKEKERIQRIQNEADFFSPEESASLTRLMDIICPEDEVSVSASAAGVLAFIQFIVKDMPHYKMPMRSGLAWMSRQSKERFGLNLNDLQENELLEILDDIAYPGDTKEEYLVGEKFFSLLRNLTLTGFYTSQEGIKDIGYMGNQPNFWDGIPEEVLQKHGFKYDSRYLDQYISDDKRGEIAKWDDEGNLI